MFARLFLAVVIGGLGASLAAAQDVKSAAKPSAPPSKEKFHLFLLVGQSNMAGRGKVEDQDKKPHPRVLMFNKEQQWVPAVDPIHFDKTSAGVGLGKTFGMTLAEANPDITIGLIPCAVGGSPIDSWKPGVFYKAANAHPWDDFQKRAKAALPAGTLKGILWHQGESDANQQLPDRTLSGENYRRYLELLIRASQKEVGWAVPWFVAQASYHSESDPGSPDIRDAQKALWSSGVALEGPDTDSLRAEYRSGVHFNGAGLRKHGQLWAEKVTPWLDQEFPQ